MWLILRSLEICIEIALNEEISDSSYFEFENCVEKGGNFKQGKSKKNIDLDTEEQKDKFFDLLPLCMFLFHHEDLK